MREQTSGIGKFVKGALVGAFGTGAAGAGAGAGIGGFAGIPFYGVGAIAGAGIGAAIGGGIGFIVGLFVGGISVAIASTGGDDKLIEREKDIAVAVGLSREEIIEFNQLTYEHPSLGHGSFGKVYRGSWQHGSIKQEVAIKELLSQIDLEQVKVDLELKREVKSMVRLRRHDNIIRLFGVCVEPGHCSLIMEYAPKGSLCDVLHRGESKNWTWPVRFNIASGISKGLEYLHGQLPCILHRDLKSSNVLLDAYNCPKITDFGSSEVRAEIDTPIPSLGALGVEVVTFLWRAPELMLNTNAPYSRSCDVYSLGVIMWEITTGELPWKGVGYNEVQVRVTKGVREVIPAATPAFFSALISRCWAQRAADRPDVGTVVRELAPHCGVQAPAP